MTTIIENDLAACTQHIKSANNLIQQRTIEWFQDVGSQLEKAQTIMTPTKSGFGDWCKREFGWSTSQVHRILDGRRTIETLLTSPIGEVNLIPLPSNDGQLRELSAVPKDELQSVWATVVEHSTTTGKPITAKSIRNVAESRRGRINEEHPEKIESDHLNVSKESQSAKWDPLILRVITDAVEDLARQLAFAKSRVIAESWGDLLQKAGVNELAKLFGFSETIETSVAAQDVIEEWLRNTPPETSATKLYQNHNPNDRSEVYRTIVKLWDRDKSARRAGLPKRSPAPTIDEVTNECDRRSLSIDPEAFWNYYESQGWLMANGNPIRNWKSALTTWERKAIGDPTVESSNTDRTRRARH
jgi:hypothetical protein